MKMQFENRKCILTGTAEDVVKSLLDELSKTDMPITYMFVPDSKERWETYHVEGWKPYRGMSCVDKIDGMLLRLQRFMKGNSEKTMFLHVEGHCGIRGLNYYLELA